eukprot:21525-Heterococcus_DN1.PRE.2
MIASPPPAAPPQPAAAAAVPYRSTDYMNAGSDFQALARALDCAKCIDEWQHQISAQWCTDESVYVHRAHTVVCIYLLYMCVRRRRRDKWWHAMLTLQCLSAPQMRAVVVCTSKCSMQWLLSLTAATTGGFQQQQQFNSQQLPQYQSQQPQQQQPGSSMLSAGYVDPAPPAYHHGPARSVEVPLGTLPDLQTGVRTSIEIEGHTGDMIAAITCAQSEVHTSVLQWLSDNLQCLVLDCHICNSALSVLMSHQMTCRMSD